MFVHVTELTGCKNAIKIQVFWLEGRILFSILQAGMRTEDGWEDQGRSGDLQGPI